MCALFSHVVAVAAASTGETSTPTVSAGVSQVAPATLVVGTGAAAAAGVHTQSFGGLFLERCYGLVIMLLGICMSCLWWIYGKTISEPLRTFYYIGLWGNMRPEQVCFELTDKKVDSSWWTASPDRIEECKRMMTAEYESFEVLVMGSLYIASLVFTVFYLICRCCFLRPLLRELRTIWGGG